MISTFTSFCPACKKNGLEDYDINTQNRRNYCTICGFRYINFPAGYCLVNKNRKICYIPIPKNASTSIRSLLSRHNFIESNYYENLLELEGYDTFTIIRHPIERFRSSLRDIKFNHVFSDVNDLVDKITNQEIIDLHAEKQSWFLRGVRVNNFILFNDDLNNNLFDYIKNKVYCDYRDIEVLNKTKAYLCGVNDISYGSMLKLVDFYEDDFRLYNSLLP